jgi:hypothetical protein
MVIFEIIGILVVGFFAVLIFLLFLYTIFVKKSEPYVTPDYMPFLKPIPIPTRSRPVLMRILVWIFEVRQWELVNNWYFQLDNGVQIVISKGFIFDGASIPRPLWALLSPVGLLLIPGLIHDYGYKFDQLWQVNKDGTLSPFLENSGRKVWDDLFRSVGRQVNGFSFIDTLAWAGLRVGGFIAWNKHRNNDEKPDQPVT